MPSWCYNGWPNTVLICGCWCHHDAIMDGLIQYWSVDIDAIMMLYRWIEIRKGSHEYIPGAKFNKLMPYNIWDENSEMEIAKPHQNKSVVTACAFWGTKGYTMQKLTRTCWSGSLHSWYSLLFSVCSSSLAHSPLLITCLNHLFFMLSTDLRHWSIALRYLRILR